MTERKKVAVFQNTITGGGRIRVVNEMITVLNEQGIAPDIYTFRVNPSFKKDEHLRFTIKKLPQFLRGFYELKIVLLNYLMRSRSAGYDLLINSNNSLLFLPQDVPILTYMYFPREMRIFTDFVSLAFPDGKLVREKGPAYRFYRNLLRKIYSLRKYTANNTIIADSEFTKSMFLKAYPTCPVDSVRVIYPPVDLGKWRSATGQRQETVTTLGRFNPEKRQLEQIQIAENLPVLQFNIIGFVGDRESRYYFDLCRRYAAEKKIKNVRFFYNLTQEKTVEMLHSSKYFMHNLRNEPFGLSTVEAVAAGCIPIVPDSGGQVEIVPFAELRFKSREEAIAKLRKINGMNLEKMKQDLAKNIAKFDLSQFKEKMKEVLDSF